MKTGTGILKLVGKAAAKVIIWVAHRLEGGKPFAVTDLQMIDFTPRIISDGRYLKPLRCHTAFSLTADRCLFCRNPDKGSRIQFPSNPPVHTGTFEAVGSLAFFLFRITLRTHILFANPLFLFLVPDLYRTIQAPSYLLMAPLPSTG